MIQAVSAGNASYEIAIAARDTRIVCHDGRPWESSYVPSGAQARYPTLTETTVQLVTATGKMDEYKDVTVEKLAAHINSCAKHRAVAPPFKCYGNLYDITLDSAGQIITVEELHP